MQHKIFNFNVGILGHVDSGKTTLAKCLSTVASTAAFDKNPQSQERGITLDLGFSSFSVDITEKLKSKDSRFAEFEKIQFTLVDCPGHASLIKTVIGGAQIIDLVILVVDCQKGVQTQTAECLVLAEITCPHHMVVVLNKVDLFADSKSIDKVTRKLQKTMESTAFAQAPILPMSCTKSDNSNYVSLLIDTLMNALYIPQRDSQQAPFLFAVDHCFGIKGQGTVLTGTVISGSVKVNDTIEIPSMKVIKKVKSIQIFRQPIDKISQGDRAGLCVAQLDSKEIERGQVCEPGYLKNTYAVLATFQLVRFFKSKLSSRTKLHISIAHETVMARCTFFGSADKLKQVQDEEFDFGAEYAYIETVYDNEEESSQCRNAQSIFCLLEFDHPFLCPTHCLYIASKLDVDQHSNVCRLAFHGRLLYAFHDKDYLKNGSLSMNRLKIFKNKQRQGVVERMTDDYGVIVTGLFKKQTNMDAFVNMKVQLSTGECGYIEGHFGQSGKAKIRITCNNGLNDTTKDILLLKNSKGKKRAGKLNQLDQETNAEKSVAFDPVFVYLKFKRYVYDAKKLMIQ